MGKEIVHSSVLEYRPGTASQCSPRHQAPFSREDGATNEKTNESRGCTAFPSRRRVLIHPMERRIQKMHVDEIS